MKLWGVHTCNSPVCPQVYQALQVAGSAKRGGQREVDRQQRELRQAVILAAEITVSA